MLIKVDEEYAALMRAHTLLGGNIASLKAYIRTLDISSYSYHF